MLLEIAQHFTQQGRPGAHLTSGLKLRSPKVNIAWAEGLLSENTMSPANIIAIDKLESSFTFQEHHS